MKILETDRLALRWFDPSDAAFVLELFNDPAFLQFIGDKNVHSLSEAKDHIENRLAKSYADNGFGLNLVSLKDNHAPIGMCGLINRDELDDVDIGYAYLPDYCGKGYAFEAAAAVLAHGQDTLGIEKIVAITALDNIQSVKLLKKLGLSWQKIIKMNDDDPGTNYYC